MYSKELLKGTLKTMILKLLAEQGRMYGYEMTQRIKELSEGKILVKEGSLYPTLHRLLDDGVVQTESEMIGKRVRKYYSLTPTGGSLVKDQIQEFNDFVKTMQVILSPDPNLNLS